MAEIENPTIKLMEPVPEKVLTAWLHEFYGKIVKIESRTVLRHRDFSYVERIHLEDSLPESLIYKLVKPPWDIEQDLHERVLVPSISSSAQLFMTAHHGSTTALFMEDLGNEYLTEHADSDKAQTFGEDLAKMHRSYSYRMEELMESGILRNFSAGRIMPFTEQLIDEFFAIESINDSQADILSKAAGLCKEALADETTSLIHGDLYAENIVARKEKLYVFDWSWFTCVSVPLIDVASLTSDHKKNGKLRQFKDRLLEAYCFESGRKVQTVQELCPYALALEKIQFLKWLYERKSRGVLGTTAGPVDDLISSMVIKIKELVRI